LLDGDLRKVLRHFALAATLTAGLALASPRSDARPCAAGASDTAPASVNSSAITTAGGFAVLLNQLLRIVALILIQIPRAGKVRFTAKQNSVPWFCNGRSLCRLVRRRGGAERAGGRGLCCDGVKEWKAEKGNENR
jgi:hypothetical protein